MKHPSWKVLYSDQKHEETFYQQVKEWGYNAVLVDKATPFLQKLGFKTIFKVDFQEEIFPFEEGYREKIHDFIKSLPQCDALFWNSPYFALDCRKHLLEHAKLKIELLQEELHTLESFAPLFYWIPPGVSLKNFSQLEAATGPKTFLVFSEDSPYWKIRQDKSLPVIEGLSEEIPLFLSETGRLLDQLRPGAFIKIDRPLHSYAACHLEGAVKAMEGSVSFEDFGREWLKNHRPEMGEETHLLRALAGFAEKNQFFKAIQRGAHIPFEELKMQCELLAAEVKLFHYHLHQKEGGKFCEEAKAYLNSLMELSKELSLK